MSNSAQDATSATTSSFLTSLAVNSVVAATELIGFLLARRFIKAIYEPRTYIPQTKQQAPVLGKNLLYPIWTIIQADPQDILTKNGVDPYVFYRFLVMMSKALIPIWLLSWAILLPVDGANSTVLNKSGLDKFTFGNVAKDKQSRLWAHLILDYVFIAWILYLIWGEMAHWLVVRQRHLISPKHSKLPQANTVLITDIPGNYLDEEKLEQLFSRLPGGVKRIWLNRDLKEMPKLWERRMKAGAMLEKAEVQLIKLAQKHKVDTEAKLAKLEHKKKPIPETLAGPANPDLISKEAAPGKRIDQSMLGRADQLVPRSSRPTMKLKPYWAPFGLGFLGIGQKVDKIDWARREVAECSEGLERGREQLRKDVNTIGIGQEYYPPLNSAFIHFNQQIAAHMAAQVLAHNEPYKMNNRYIEMAPQNVIWKNLSLNAYEQNVRRAISYAATFGLIILWVFPVTFIGLLSSVSDLTSTYKWLSWLNWLEGSSFAKQLLRGVVEGVLPPILLALLNQLLPSVLRQLAVLEGVPSKTGVELNLMTRYFIFLVIHTFFTVTLSSGLLRSIKPLIENPSSVATILASQMPTASTFFITLILTQFTGVAGNFLRPVSLLLYYIRVILAGATPRSIFRSRYRLASNGMGARFPSITVYAVIVIGYCVISPVINGFGALFFLISAMSYKYIYIWVEDHPPDMDTGGIFFPKAITHVFVGIYIQEVCLCALFFLARNANEKASAIPQGALMVVLIVLTAAVHYVISTSYGPLIDALPLSLAHLSYGMPKEEGHEGSLVGAEADGSPDSNLNSTSREHLTGQNGQEFTRVSSHDSPPKPSYTLPNPLPVPVPSRIPSSHFHNHTGPSQGVPTSAGPPIQFELDNLHPQHSQTDTNTNTNTDIEANNDEYEETYFAIPGGPGTMQRTEQDGNDPNAFFHPATKEPARILWLPKDELGLCEAEIRVNSGMGIGSTCRYAVLGHKGEVRISGPPPDLF